MLYMLHWTKVWSIHVTLGWIICGRPPVFTCCGLILLSSQCCCARNLDCHHNTGQQVGLHGYKYTSTIQVSTGTWTTNTSAGHKYNLAWMDCHHKTGNQKWDFIQVQVHTSASRGMASWQHSSSVTQPTQHRSGLRVLVGFHHYTTHAAVGTRVNVYWNQDGRHIVGQPVFALLQRYKCKYKHNNIRLFTEHVCVQLAHVSQYNGHITSVILTPANTHCCCTDPLSS